MDPMWLYGIVRRLGRLEELLRDLRVFRGVGVVEGKTHKMKANHEAKGDWSEQEYATWLIVTPKQGLKDGGFQVWLRLELGFSPKKS